MAIFITDLLTNEYYCVEMTATNADGLPTAGDNDFPYWSPDIDQAYNFETALAANNEIAASDLTVDGTRRPSIIEVLTYREAIQALQQAIQRCADAAGILRDCATLNEKKYWNSLRGLLLQPYAILGNLDNSLSDARATMITSSSLSELIKG
jgi:hypothetical protein